VPKNKYFVSLELPSEDANLPYQSAGDFESVDFDELAEIVKEHLQKANSRPTN